MLDLSLTPEMGMRVTPALLNLAHLLTLPTMELHQAVQHELTENPALEEVESQEETCPRCHGPVVEGLCLRCALDSTGSERTLERSDDETDPLLFVAAPRNLNEMLLSDLRASLPESEYPLAVTLVGSLDEQGFLSDDIDDIAGTLGVDVARLEIVLERLREVGPPGIATRDTRECLLSQIDALAAEGVTFPYVREIVDEYLDDLGAHRYRYIARQLQITPNDVEAARNFIHDKLWPYPLDAAVGSTRSPDRTRYRTPDIAIVENDDGDFVVEVLHSPRRMVRINPLYQDLSSKAASLDEEERAHVQEYIARARVFLANLRQRESTLQRIGEAIVQRQQDFLRNGVRHLTPMTRSEIAAALGLHESTVSRATADKTVILPNKTLLPISELFVAARRVQDVLRELIANETSPLSDEELARLLTDQGYPIARRTVAKYRDQLRIPPSHQR
jgi:RNA polymerase sigma-54 factor